jgi:hypothetical protein
MSLNDVDAANLAFVESLKAKQAAAKFEPSDDDVDALHTLADETEHAPLIGEAAQLFLSVLGRPPAERVDGGGSRVNGRAIGDVPLLLSVAHQTRDVYRARLARQAEAEQKRVAAVKQAELQRVADEERAKRFAELQAKQVAEAADRAARDAQRKLDDEAVQRAALEERAAREADPRRCRITLPPLPPEDESERREREKDRRRQLASGDTLAADRAGLDCGVGRGG